MHAEVAFGLGSLRDLLLPAWISVSTRLPPSFLLCSSPKSSITLGPQNTSPSSLSPSASVSLIQRPCVGGNRSHYKGISQLQCRAAGLVLLGRAASPLRKINDRNPLVHVAALPAKTNELAEGRVFPWRRMWILGTMMQRLMSRTSNPQ